jgi:hypothetical protein
MKSEPMENICIACFFILLFSGAITSFVVAMYSNDTYMDLEFYNSKYTCNILEMEPNCIVQKIQFYVNIDEIKRNVSEEIEYPINNEIPYTNECETLYIKYEKEGQFDCYFYKNKLYDSINTNVVNYYWYQHPMMIVEYSIVAIVILIGIVGLCMENMKNNKCLSRKNSQLSINDLEKLINKQFSDQTFTLINSNNKHYTDQTFNLIVSKYNEINTKINDIKALVLSRTDEIKNVVNGRLDQLTNLVKEKTIVPSVYPKIE